MKLIEIQPLSNGAHRNQTVSRQTDIPEGWALIPDDMEIPSSFPFVDIEAAGGKVTSMTERDVPTGNRIKVSARDRVVSAVFGSYVGTGSSVTLSFDIPPQVIYVKGEESTEFVEYAFPYQTEKSVTIPSSVISELYHYSAFCCTPTNKEEVGFYIKLYDKNYVDDRYTQYLVPNDFTWSEFAKAMASHLCGVDEDTNRVFFSESMAKSYVKDKDGNFVLGAEKIRKEDYYTATMSAWETWE